MKCCLLLAFLFILNGVNAQKKQISVSVHPTLEVINAICIPLYPEMLQDSLADPWIYRNTRLMRLANAYFQPYYSHPSVEISRRMIQKIGTGIYLLPLYYEQLPVVKIKSRIPDIILNEVHTSRDTALMMIDTLMQSAADFWRFSRFQDFQKKYRYVYEGALKQVKSNLPGQAFISTLEQYYGDKKDGYNIIVMPFFKSQWGMGWEVEANGGKQIFNIAAPFEEQEIRKEQVLDAGYNNGKEVANLSVHEFGHSFVNTLTTSPAYAGKVSAFAHLYQPIKSDPQYNDWLTVFNEYVVRAGEILVMKQIGDHAFAAKTKDFYKDWVYLDHFIRQMELYLNNRKEYPSFEQFLPVLIQSLSALEKPRA